MSTFLARTLAGLFVALAAGFLAHSIPVGAAVFAVTFIFIWVPIYVRYAKDNPSKVWFKRKLFGWGWTPVTWQGWLVILIFALLVLLFASTIDEASPTREVVFTFIFPVFFLSVLLIRIAYKKGEKPRWEWGKEIDKYRR